MGYNVRLVSIRIKNFRSILDEIIYFDNCNIFVGKNDCGKSNVLKALNLFFNGETDYHKKYNFYSDYCQKGKTGKGKAQEITIELEIKLPTHFTEKGKKIWKKVWRKDGLFSDNMKDIFGPYSKGPTYLSRVIFKYIPAVKSSNYFQNLLLEIYNSMTASADATLSKVNQQYSQTLERLTVELSANLQKNIGIKSLIQMPKDLGVLFENMRVSTGDVYVKNIDLDNRGDGVKARHIPSMLLFISQKIKESREKNAVGYTVIWGYEEPENGVEFSACRLLAEELYLYSRDNQVLMTTHSPAIYNLKEKAQSKCYYVFKNDIGLSKYESDFSVAEIDDKIGIMPLITPYINEITQKLEEQEKEKQEIVRTLAEEIEAIKAVRDKAYLFTEGETDAVLLNKAIEKLEIKDLDIEISSVNKKTNKKGNVSIFTLLNELKNNNVNNNIVIGMFDRDVEQKIKDINDVEYRLNETRFVKISSNIAAFAIPIPHNRPEVDQISIEHYFTDDEIKRSNEKGQRLFLGNEFNKVGNHKVEDYNYHYIGDLYNKIKIIECETNKYVTNKNGEGNYSLSKKHFAEAVAGDRHNFSDFNFSEFNKIFDVIREIIKDLQ